MANVAALAAHSTFADRPDENHQLPRHRLLTGRNFVTLKIETDEGVHGVGDATLNGRELSVASISPTT